MHSGTTLSLDLTWAKLLVPTQAHCYPALKGTNTDNYTLREQGAAEEEKNNVGCMVGVLEAPRDREGQLGGGSRDSS